MSSQIPATTAIRAIVSGRVHGVGFRFSTRQTALRLGVSGWVRNRPDGTVEVWAQGEAGSVDALLEYLRRGPPAAIVQDVAFTMMTPEPGHRSFHITA